MLRKEGIRVNVRPRARVSTRPRMSQARSGLPAQSPSASTPNIPKEKYSRFPSIDRAYHNLLAFAETAKALALNPTLWRSILRGTVFFIVSANLYATAWGTYATFYARYIPVLTSVTPIYFDFGKNFPSTKIPAVSNNRQALFDYGQPYDITLELDVPESAINLDLGNFMVRLELQNRAGRDLYVSQRPTMIVYRSALLRGLSTIAYSIPLLLDMKSEHRTLKIPLAEGFMDDYDDIITHVEVVISNPKIQIYNSRLRIDAHLTGLRYIMYHWSAIAAAFFTSFFFVAEIVFCIFAWQLGVYIWGRIQLIDQAEEASQSAESNQSSASSLGSSEGTEQAEPQLAAPESSTTMPPTEEEEWERLSNHLSTGAITPPGMTPLDQTPQNASNLASILRYRANYSLSPTQSFVRGEDSNLDIDLLRFMSQAQDHLTTSSSHTELDLERQTGTLVGFDGTAKDNDIGEGPSTDFYPTPASEATARGRYTPNKKAQ
ncbi:hypothetical protein DSO57_1028907 [Entomophthora muscae]|uniref:Uncharacterized protein n=1 Tax=Entomophthora muscae TaxID=34485 RepID=A0ACC2TZB5_9FUNG|nr:hypothetical protein DSO57_1028907 [Entomophthora muscae]